MLGILGVGALTGHSNTANKFQITIDGERL